MEGVTINVQGAAIDGDPVLYDIFHLVQYLLDKGKIYTLGLG